jgi:hypothetical protein
MRLRQARFGRKHALVDLTSPARRPRLDSAALELVLRQQLIRRLGVEQLDARFAVLVVRDAIGVAAESAPVRRGRAP